MSKEEKIKGTCVPDYFDKHGEKIEAGMTLRHDSGETWDIMQTTNRDTGEEDLGMACNEGEAYPLWQFNLNEWEIVHEAKPQ